MFPFRTWPFKLGFGEPTLPPQLIFEVGTRSFLPGASRGEGGGVEAAVGVSLF